MNRQEAEKRYYGGMRGVLRRHPLLYRIVFRVLAPVLVTGPNPKDVLGSLADQGGLVLDLGSGNDRRHPRFTNVDRVPFPEVDIIADLEELPIDDGRADGVVSIAVLEHVREPTKALAEIHRVLKTGGRLYVVVPFLQPFHAAPHDYHRWTTTGLGDDLTRLGFHVHRTGVYCGPSSALAWMLAEYASLILSLGSARLRALLNLPLQVLFSPLKWLDLILCRLPESEKVASAIYAEATRK